MPAGPGPLGGARRGELRAYWLHRGEQTQRFHPHRRLHPLDRGDSHQGLLPTLSGPLESTLTANISSDLFHVRCPETTKNCFFFFFSKPQLIYVAATSPPFPELRTISRCKYLF